MVAEVEAIDAMVADIEANAGLPPHQVVKYRRPRMILPTDCPLLVVVLDEAGSTEAPAGTVRFRSLVPIALEWHEEAVEEVETLVDDPELSVSLIANAKRIQARVRKWAIATASMGGVDLGVDAIEESGLGAVIPFTLEDGLVEGVRVLTNVLLTEDA